MVLKYVIMFAGRDWKPSVRHLGFQLPRQRLGIGSILGQKQYGGSAEDINVLFLLLIKQFCARVCLLERRLMSQLSVPCWNNFLERETILTLGP